MRRRQPDMLYWLDTGRACGGVIVGVSDGTVIDCAPIWRRDFMAARSST